MTATVILTRFDGNPPEKLLNALSEVSTQHQSFLKGFSVNRTGITCVHTSLEKKPDCDTVWILNDDFINEEKSYDLFEILKSFDQLMVALHKSAQHYNSTLNEIKTLFGAIPVIYVIDTHHLSNYSIPDLCGKMVGRALNHDTDRVLELQSELNSFISKYNTLNIS